MAGPRSSQVIVTLLLCGINCVLAIQNNQTSLRSTQDDRILRTSAYSDGEATLDTLQRKQLSVSQRTAPVLQLESSKSANALEIDDSRIIFNDANEREAIHELTFSKHINQIDENNIEIQASDYHRTAPTYSEFLPGDEKVALRGRGLSSRPSQSAGSTNQPRQPRQGISRIYSEHAPPPILQTASPGRQANPDIQDIITGIVKLLNGNVNVVANTVRPPRPIQATRINNRGPPRISDVPPLPSDFDTPGMNPPPPPAHPYPFETPPTPAKPFLNGVPLPEQIVPQGNHPWNWHRPGGNRRPTLAHKPLPPLDSSFHRDKNPNLADDHSDKVYLDMKVSDRNITHAETTTNKLEGNHRNATVESEPSEASTKHEIAANGGGEEQVTEAAKPPLNKDFSQIDSNAYKAQQTSSKEEIKKGGNVGSAMQRHSSNLGTTTAAFASVKPTPEDNVLAIQTTKIDDHTRSTAIFSHNKSTNGGTVSSDLSRLDVKPNVVAVTTLKVETSSSIQEMKPTPTSPTLQSTMIFTESQQSQVSPFATSLEPSKTSNLDTKDIGISSSIPTETLPPITARPTSNTLKPAPHLTSSTFIKHPATDHYAYRPRPGIVLDDTLDYTGSPGYATQRPYASSRHPPFGDIFDVTVSAVQGSGGGSGESVRIPINSGSGGADVILTTAVEGQGFVSIDGKRTYLNLFDNTDRTSDSTQVRPQATHTQSPAIGTGFAVPQVDEPQSQRPTFHRRPTQPPVRIDTCIVGDKSTCDASQHEACATVQGVSACHCKPGYARLQHTLPCKKIVSIVVSMRVDKIYERRVVWDRGFSDKESDSYQTLAYEANRAIESAMSMTPFSDEYMESLVNNVYQGDVSQGQGGVFVNVTLKLTYEARTVRPSLAGELQRHLLGVIHRRNNNIGNSALYVDSPAGSISNLQDLDECASSELNDCHSSASCTNIWGGFICSCNVGLKDPHVADPNEAGRTCLTCPSTYCNNRGTCSYHGDQMHCTCTGNYYGAECEVDGEVLGVAIGASVAAFIIIVLTLIGLVMWSRRWSREQKAVGSPVYGYIQGGIPGTLPGTLARVGSIGTLASVKQGPLTSLPPYMWAHFGEHMASANVYATEPMGPTRPSSAIFGYPPLNIHSTLPPVPLPRLQAPPRPRMRHHQSDPDSSDSEPQDKDRADLIPQDNGFHVPRPKSRMSLTNQSGIYNDVEYDQGDVHHLSNKNNIPMSTYRPYYRT